MEKKSFKVSGYHPIAQQAINELRSELTTSKVYEVTIDSTCDPNIGGYVSTGDTHVIHLCPSNIERKLRGLIDPQEQKEALKAEIKDIVLRHELKHVEQLSKLEQQGQIDRTRARTPIFETEAEKQERWESMEPFGITHRMSSYIDDISNALESKGFIKEAYQLDIISNTIDKLAYPYYKSDTGKYRDLSFELMSEGDIRDLLEDYDAGETIEFPKVVQRDSPNETREFDVTKINKDTGDFTLHRSFIDVFRKPSKNPKGSLHPEYKYDHQNKKVVPITSLKPIPTVRPTFQEMRASEYPQYDMHSGEFKIDGQNVYYSIGGIDFGMPEVFFKTGENIRSSTDEIRGDVGGGTALKIFKKIQEIIQEWINQKHPDKFFISSEEPERTRHYDFMAKRIVSRTGYNYNPELSDIIKRKHAELGSPVDKVWVFESPKGEIHKKRISTVVEAYLLGGMDYTIPYTDISNYYEIYKDPTENDIHTILETSSSPFKSIRVAVDSLGDIYAWNGDLVHDAVARHLHKEWILYVDYMPSRKTADIRGRFKDITKQELVKYVDKLRKIFPTLFLIKTSGGNYIVKNDRGRTRLELVYNPEDILSPESYGIVTKVPRKMACECSKEAHVKKAFLTLEKSKKESELYYKKHKTDLTDEQLKRIHKKLIGKYKGIKFYWVDSNYVRNNIDVDFTTGGNTGVYKFIPEGEIWLEDHKNPKEIVANMIHEYVEMNKMIKDGWNYDRAHNYASGKELKFRNKNLIIKDLMKSFKEYIEKVE